MRLKLDENLGKQPLELFLEAEHDAVTVKDKQLSGADDRKLMAVCKEEKRCLVIHAGGRLNLLSERLCRAPFLSPWSGRPWSVSAKGTPPSPGPGAKREGAIRFWHRLP